MVDDRCSSGGVWAGARCAAGVLVGLDGFEVCGAAERGGVLEVQVRSRAVRAACPGCGVLSGRVKQRRVQRVCDLGCFGRPVVLLWHKRRFRCGEPGCVGSFTESAAQIPARKRLTRRLRSAVAEAARDCATLSAARAHGVGWHTAWSAVERAAAAELEERGAAPPRRIGIDETTFRRPRRFMTSIVDLDTSRLFDIFEGRSKKALAERLRALGADAGLVEAVVIDPFAGYKAAAREHLPKAVRVADRFHIQRLADKAATDTRRRVQQDHHKRRGRKGDPLYSARRDLTRSRHRLTPTAQQRLDAAFGADTSDDLRCAWTLKEMIRDLYSAPDRHSAEQQLHDWHQWARAYDVAETNRLANTLHRWQPEILNYFDTGLTNGPTEARNLIIKQTKRQGYGYTNPHNYRLKILYRSA